MSVRIDTYTLLVSKVGEATAYKICEELGGTTLKIPKVAHRGYRVRQLIKRALPIIKNDTRKRAILVKRLSKLQDFSEVGVRTIMREIEYGK